MPDCASRARVSFLAGCVLLSSVPFVGAQETAGAGLDVGVLVDVSRSMYTRERTKPGTVPPPNGSDPERMRWDAVLLILNLLSAEDRVLILPFNDDAPARAPDAEKRPQLVPGRLALDLSPANDVRLLHTIERFIHSEDRRNVVDGTINSDMGGTSIFRALRTGADRFGRPSATPGRRRAVILLTDGKEGESGNARFYERDADLRALIGPWAGGNGQPSTPVYTVGLGPEADETLLVRIALLTNGSYTKLESNGQLIDAFRKLIWEMKGCWYKSVDTAESRRDVEVVQGIYDIGVLAHDLLPAQALPDGRPDPRNTSPPDPAVDFQWRDAAGQRVPRASESDRSRPGAGGYTYRYFGPGLSQFFHDHPARLELSWLPSSRAQRLYIAKRTAVPLFEIVEPKDGTTYAHHEAVRVRVALKAEGSSYFRPEQFHVSARLTRAGRIEKSVDLYNRDLARVPATRVYEDEVALGALPRGDNKKDYYTLHLAADGINEPGRSGPLAGFHLDLPGRTIAVANSTVLEPVAAVELSREHRIRSIVLNSRAPLPGDHELSVRFDAPTTGGKAVPANAISVRQVDPPMAPGEYRLHDGRATLELVLHPNEALTSGVVYEPGRLALSSRSGKELVPLEVAIGLRLGLIKLRLTQDEARLEAGATQDRSPPIRVLAEATKAEIMTLGALRVTLEAKDKKEPLPYANDELWLEKEGAAAGPRERVIEIAPGDAFRCVFQPRQDLSRVGPRHAIWKVEGSGVVPVRGALALEYKAPRLVVAEQPRVVHATRGRSCSVAVPVRLVAPAGQARAIRFRPARVDSGRAVFERIEGQGPRAAALAIDFPGQDDEHPPFLIEASRSGGVDTGSQLNLGISVPANLEYGRYRLDGVLLGDDVAATPLAVELVVNALQILAPGPGGTWTPCDESVDAPARYEREWTRTLRVRTALGPLPSDQLVVEVPRKEPFQNEDGHDLKGSLPTIDPARDIGVVPSGSDLQVRIHFPAVSTAHPFTPYLVDVFFSSPALELEPRRLTFRVKFVEEDGRIQIVPRVRPVR